MENLTNQTNDTIDVEQKIGQHKKKKRLIILSCAGTVLAIAAALVIINFEYIENFAHKTFSSPESYARWVTGKLTDSFASDASNGYNAALLAGRIAETDTSPKGYSLGLSAEFGPLLSQNLDIEGLEVTQAGLEATVMSGNTIRQANLLLSLNNGTLCTLEAITDSLSGLGYLKLAELSDAYLEFETAEDDYSDIAEEPGRASSVIDALLNKSSMSIKDLKALLRDYSDFIMDTLPAPELADTTLEDGSDVTGIRLTVSRSELVSLFDALGGRLSSDVKVEQIIKNAAEKDSTIDVDTALENISKFFSALTYLLKDSGLEQLVITYKVDSRGDICGIDLDASNGFDNYSFSASGSYLSISRNGEMLYSAVSDITEKDGVSSGTVTMSFSNDYITSLIPDSLYSVLGSLIQASGSESTITFEYTDFKFNPLTSSGGGHINITTSLLPGGVVAVELEDVSVSGANISFKLTYSGAPIITLKLGVRETGYKEPSLPGSHETVYGEAESDEYIMDSDFLGFLSKVYENTGLDLTPILYKYILGY